MSQNIVLVDENENQVLPITTSENVFVEENKTLQQKLAEIDAKLEELSPTT